MEISSNVRLDIWFQKFQDQSDSFYGWGFRDIEYEFELIGWIRIKFRMKIG